jgi:hypothetical protein
MSRQYWGCEMESPIYREVAEEMRLKKEPYSLQSSERTKRGKRSNKIKLN